jgi:hypothetical protein
MAWKIVHLFDAEHDVVTIRFTDVVLATPEDVERWRSESEARYKQLHRRVDCLVDMAGLDVHPAMRQAWTLARSYLARHYMKRVYRYNGNARTRTAVFTGSVLGQAGGEVYGSREEALAKLLEDRTKDAAG